MLKYRLKVSIDTSTMFFYIRMIDERTSCWYEIDLTDTYLPAFQTCVQKARASSIMCSYNSVNGNVQFPSPIPISV
jgi:hypothetical protein